MARLTRQVLADRAIRDAARAAFDGRLAQVKTDLAARSIGGRVADKAVDEALAVLDEAKAVADGNRAIVAGTIAALVLWFLRNPILAGLEKAMAAIVKLLEEKDLLP